MMPISIAQIIAGSCKEVLLQVTSATIHRSLATNSNRSEAPNKSQVRPPNYFLIAYSWYNYIYTYAMRTLVK